MLFPNVTSLLTIANLPINIPFPIFIFLETIADLSIIFIISRPFSNILLYQIVLFLLSPIHTKK